MRAIPRQGQSGFSLLEMIATVAVVAILASIALPSLQTTMQRNQVNTEVNRLLADLLYARNEAVTRSRVVTLCKSSDQVSCGGGSGGQYDVGWMTYMATGPRVAYANVVGFERLRVGSPAGGNVQIRSPGAQAPSFISYLPSGRVDPVVAGSIVISVCYNGQSTVEVPGKRLTITVSGKPSVSAVAPGGC